MPHSDAVVVLTTVGTEDDAAALVRALLERRLVACGTMLPRARSIYRWDNKVADETEVVLMLKTRSACLDALQASFETLHPYKLPELLVLPVAAGLPEVSELDRRRDWSLDSVKVKLDRRVLAAAVLVCWGIGLAWLARRRHDVSDTDRLAQGVLRLEPGTYFYTVEQTGQPIGWASSSLDTTATGFTSRDAVRVRALIAGDSQSVIASSTAHLTRAFALDTFALTVSGDEHPFQLREMPAAGSGVLLPSLAPIAIMLTREPRIGASTVTQIYNPLSRRVETVTLSIAAESLFSVVDSAVFDTARKNWVAAHIDTVRSWQLVPPSRAISAWVDSRGRLVAASEPGGLSMTRSTYEIATLNQKLPKP